MVSIMTMGWVELKYAVLYICRRQAQEASPESSEHLVIDPRQCCIVSIDKKMARV